MYYNKQSTYPVPIDPSWDVQDSSKIKAYMSCPRRYFYEYVLGWRSIHPSNHLIFGTAWHEAMAHIYLTDFSKNNILKAYEKFLESYRKDIDEEDDELYWPKTPERAFKALIYYCGIYKDDHSKYEVLEYNGQKLVEIGGKISISSDYEVSFRQDTILKGSQGIFSLEHKTCSSTYNWSEQWYLNPATAIYSHVLYCLFNKDDVAGIKYNGTCFKKTKDDPKKDEKEPFRHFDTIRTPIYKTPDNMASMLVNIIWWLDMIKNDFDNLSEAKDSDSFMACYPQNWTNCNSYGRTCEYHDFCINWKNPLRHVYNLPIDMKVEFWNPLNEPVRVEVNV